MLTAPAIDRESAVPLYYQIHLHLLHQIEEGLLKPGDLLPSEQEIATRIGVSRMTARQAVKSLCDAGVAYSRRGRGTFVSRGKQEKTSTELLSFTQEMNARGSRPTSRVISFDYVQAGAEVATALHLTKNTKVLRLVRVRMADSSPMGVESSFLPASLFAGLKETFDPRTSLYQALAKQYGVRMVAADEVTEVGLATTEVANLLAVQKGAPVFIFKRTSYAESQRPVEYVQSTYRGDRWKIVSRLSTSEQSGGDARRVAGRQLLPLHAER